MHLDIIQTGTVLSLEPEKIKWLKEITRIWKSYHYTRATSEIIINETFILYTMFQGPKKSHIEWHTSMTIKQKKTWSVEQFQMQKYLNNPHKIRKQEILSTIIPRSQISPPGVTTQLDTCPTAKIWSVELENSRSLWKIFMQSEKITKMLQ